LQTHKSQRLEFTNFNSRFITHGIDVISDPSAPDGEAVYIFAVNHLPHPDYLAHVSTAKAANITPAAYGGPKARSQVEIFHHVIGTTNVQHMRSVQHPLIMTPNDLIAVSPTSFYVTNDHHYREGIMREVEDLYFGAKWSSVVHVRLPDLRIPPGGDAPAGVDAVKVVTGLHNTNGIGHGPGGQVLINSCVSGTLHVGKLPPLETSVEKYGLDEDRGITMVGHVPMESTIDNPTYFSDPYATAGEDKSGYVLAGLTRAVDFMKQARVPGSKIPVLVWYVTPKKVRRDGEDAFERRVIFEDDGQRVSSASTAVLVAIDPKLEGGRRKAWLYVTGPMARAIIAVKVDL
jgi:hypothetical protein